MRRRLWDFAPVAVISKMHYSYQNHAKLFGMLAVNPELLKTFLAVCRHRNFTRAAQERLLTQPAVSRQIKQLERQLGASLFEKLGKSIHLTDAGRALAPQAADLLGQMDRIAESVRAFQSPSHRRLSIGASTTPGYFILPPILGEFHRQYPDV